MTTSSRVFESLVPTKSVRESASEAAAAGVRLEASGGASPGGAGEGQGQGERDPRAAGAARRGGPSRSASLTPRLMACLGMPTPSSAALAIPTGDSPVARALRITTERTPLDRVLGGEQHAAAERGSFGGSMRILADPGLWFRGTYASVADRLMERHPQVWLALAGSRPASGKLTVNQRLATQMFVEGTGKARIAVLAGDADLQGMVRISRVKRRVLTLALFGGTIAAVAYAVMLLRLGA